MTTTSYCASTGRIATALQTSRALRCISSRSPANAWVTRLSRLRITSRAKSTPVPSEMALTSSCTGLPSQIPQVARGCPIRLASWSVRTVSRPASPGATIFGPPLNPAKKCGSTNPVVILTSASTQARFNNT